MKKCAKPLSWEVLKSITMLFTIRLSFRALKNTIETNNVIQQKFKDQYNFNTFYTELMQ